MTGIYIISEGESGPVKIGKSASVVRRMDEMQAFNPRKLRLVEVWTVDVRNVHKVEREIHRALKEHNILGEWFNLSESDVSRWMDLFFEGKLFQHSVYRPVIN